MIPPVTALPGMRPAGSPLVNTPPPASGDSLSQSICRALGQPVRVTEMNDGDGQILIVEPLKFISTESHNDGGCSNNSEPATP